MPNETATTAEEATATRHAWGESTWPSGTIDVDDGVLTSEAYCSAMTSPASIYAATRDQLVNDLRELSDDESATTIESCPEWSAKDVLAHVSGLVADLLAGVKPPLGTDEMTARQVAERSAMTHGEI